MNSDFKGIMSNELDRIVASKSSVIFKFCQNYSKERKIIGILV